MTEKKLSAEQAGVVSGEWNGIPFTITPSGRSWMLEVGQLVTAMDNFSFLNRYVDELGGEERSVVLSLDRTTGAKRALFGKAGSIRFHSDEELARIKEHDAQGRGSVSDITGPEFSYGGF